MTAEERNCLVRINDNSVVLGHAGGSRIWVTVYVARQLIEQNVVKLIQGPKEFTPAETKPVGPTETKKFSVDLKAGPSTDSASSTQQPGPGQSSSASAGGPASAESRSQPSVTPAAVMRDPHASLRSTTRTNSRRGRT